MVARFTFPFINFPFLHDIFSIQSNNDGNITASIQTKRAYTLTHTVRSSIVFFAKIHQVLTVPQE